MKHLTASLRVGLLASAVVIAGLQAAPAQAADYVQQRGGLSFVGKYQGETFTGLFPGFSTRLQFDPANPAAAKLDVDIPLATADTRNGERDTTLKGADFFNVGRFATARYSAHGFTALGGDRYRADGTLQLRGISKPVSLTFSLSSGDNPVLVGQAVVKRLDFDVGGGDWADLSIIPNEIAVATRVTFRKAP
jgi:polyisoprenoid-binding protein YceI